MPATKPNYGPTPLDWNTYLKSLGGGGAGTPGYIPPMPGEGGEPAVGTPATTPIASPVGATVPTTAAETATPGAGMDWQTQFNQLMAQIMPEITAAETQVEDPTKAAEEAAAAQTAYQQSVMPGYGALEAQATTNIGNELAGDVTQSTKNQLAQAAAERGVSGGTIYGPTSDASYLQALGQTSEQQQQAGETNKLAEQAATKIDPTQLIVTPSQRAQMTEDLTKTVATLGEQLQSQVLDANAKSALQDKIDASNLQIQVLQMQNQLELQKLSDTDKAALQDKIDAAQMQIAQLENSTKIALANAQAINDAIAQQKQIDAQLQMAGMNESARGNLQAQKSALAQQIAALKNQGAAMPNYQQPGYQPTVPGQPAATAPTTGAEPPSYNGLTIDPNGNVVDQFGEVIPESALTDDEWGFFYGGDQTAAPVDTSGGYDYSGDTSGEGD